MKESEIILLKLNENKDKLRQYKVEKIGLFGSYLKNKQKRSDRIDTALFCRAIWHNLLNF